MSEQENPKFTVIVPMYNVQEYISECVGSILDQTYPHFQLIVVNDASTDASAQKCRERTDGDPRVLLLNQENGGPNVARNLALDRAGGDHVVFIDADDWVEPRMLERLAQIIAKESPDIVNYGFDFLDPEAKKIRKTSHFPQLTLEGESILGESFIGANIVGVCWNKCFKRSLLEEGALRFTPDRKHGRDILFTRRCAKAARKAIVIPDILYHSRYRQQSYSRSFSPENIVSAIDLAERHMEYFADKASAETRDLLDYAVGRHLRYILILSSFRSPHFGDFRSNLNKVKSSPFWRHVLGEVPRAKAFSNKKDLGFALLLKKTRLCWAVARVLSALNYQPY